MPGIIDSHFHITIPVSFEYAEIDERLEPNGKQETFDLMSKYIKENPGQKRYRFLMKKRFLNGEELARMRTSLCLTRICLQLKRKVSAIYDYMYYYNNIKDNAAKRVTAYLNNRT